jgi:hypothetical protein
MRLLLEQMEGRPLDTEQVVIEPDLVLRESSGPAPNRRRGVSEPDPGDDR